MPDPGVIPLWVALRIRPLIEREEATGCQSCLTVVPEVSQVQVVGTEKAFTYNYVFGSDSSQDQLYNDAVKPLIQHIFNGYNVTVLAYGQTGSGKTYSMGTSHTNVDNLDGNTGVIPRAVIDIFDYITNNEDSTFTVKVSFMELYQEQLFDLLSNRSREECQVDIREDHRGSIKVIGLSEVDVESAQDTMECLLQGSAGRVTGATAMNSRSSRSHAIFTISVQHIQNGDVNSMTNAKIHFVDLAGSERAKKTKATGERLKEGININRGLLSLGNVISALGDESQKNNYIPYRDSKLTRLLQDSLGGNSHTLMIACVSPADYNLEESISTLRYADRARKIKNKPVVNRDRHAQEIANYKQQIQELQLKLLNQTFTGEGKESELQEENKNLCEKNRRLTEALQAALNEHTNMLEKALLNEQAQEKLKMKLEETSSSLEKARDDFKTTLMKLESDVDMKDVIHLLKDHLQVLTGIQSKVGDLQDDQRRNEEALLQHELTQSKDLENSAKESNDGSYEESDSVTDGDDDEVNEIHTMKQANLNNQLLEINKQLAVKESLMSKLNEGCGKISTLQSTIYEVNTLELEEKITALTKEKDELQQALRNVHANNPSNKISEQRRKRVQELEMQITNYKKKVTEQEKMIRMKEKSDERIKMLSKEIQSMKQARVKLIRQMREDGEKFRRWKMQREKELNKLKEQDRRRQNQLVKMERLHNKQTNVLRRKMEEAAAINKRLKDALALQKRVQESKKQDKGLQGLSSRTKTWLSHDLDLVCSTREAEKSLADLLEGRTTLSEQLLRLQKNRARRDLSPEEAYSLEDEIEILKTDINMRNVQITELQQKIVETDLEKQAKTRWDSIQTMLEAKCALEYLFEAAVESKLDLNIKQGDVEDLKVTISTIENLLKEKDEKYNSEVQVFKEKQVKLEQECQEKVLTLLKQISGTSFETSESMDAGLRESLVVVKGEISKISGIHDELQEVREENERLKEQLAAAAVRRGKASFFPQIDMKIPMTVPKTKLNVQQPYDPAELFQDDPSDTEDNTDEDPDWRETPVAKRLQKMKMSTEVDVLHADKKRDSTSRCMCSKGRCSNKLCGCKKNGNLCSENCRCNVEKCVNRSTNEETSNSADPSVLDSTSNCSTSNYPVLRSPLKEQNHKKGCSKKLWGEGENSGSDADIFQSEESPPKRGKFFE